MHKFFLYISYLFASLSGGETDEGEGDKEDLQKSLDSALEVMSDLVKSNGEDSSIRELMSNPKSYSKMKQMMKDFDGDEPDEEEMKKRREHMKKHGSMKGYMKGGKEKKGGEYMDAPHEGIETKKKNPSLPTHDYMETHKSLDDAISEHEEVIDAVPAFKAFTNVLASVVNDMALIKSSIDEMSQTQDENSEIVKSLANVTSLSSKLIKSTEERLQSIGNTPLPIKGQRFNPAPGNSSSGAGVLTKSFAGEDGEEARKTFSIHAVKNALMKGLEEKKISSNTISKWELSRYNPEVIPPAEQEFVKSYIEGNK